jgi:hypothetical protein
VKEENRPESKWKQPREVGDFKISDNSHRLVHQAVTIVSQMQVIATATNYEMELDKFQRDKPTMKVLGSGNAIIIGLMTVLCILKSIGDQHDSMRTFRRSLIDSYQLDERELPEDFEYRVTCTRYLEIKIMQMLVRCVANICVRSDEIDAFDCLEDSEIWTSHLMRIWLWDQVVGVAIKVDEEFKSYNYPFIESYTMNIRRDRPMFQNHFTAHATLTRSILNPDETGVLKCTGTYDMDLPELQRQYPDISWTREHYNELVVNNQKPKMLNVIRFKQISVSHMLHQTTTSITYMVDVPMTKEDVLRHEQFAHSALNRSIQQLQRTLRSSSDVMPDIAYEGNNRRRTLEDHEIRLSECAPASSSRGSTSSSSRSHYVK